MHIGNLDDALEGQLLWIVVVCRIVQELSLDSIVRRVGTIVVLEKPRHLNNAVVIVLAIIIIVNPVRHPQLKLPVQAHSTVILFVLLLHLVPQ